MNTTTSLFDLLSRKDYFDLLIHFQDRVNYGKEQLHVIFDDDDLEYIEDDDHNIIEIRHIKRYKKHLGIAMKSKRSIVKHFSLFPNLYRLNLSSVYLTGKLTVLSQLSQSLTVINLSNNHINGIIPDLSHLVNLQIVDLSRNHLTGGIDHCLSNKNLKMLYLHNNLLTGPLPSIINLPLLERIALHKNQISGRLPDLSKCCLLGNGMFHRNKINGINTYVLPKNLKQLHLYDTEMTMIDLERLKALNKFCLIFVHK